VRGFPLDEYVNPMLGRSLRERLPDAVVMRVGDFHAPPLGTLDPEILLWCEVFQLWLVTYNRASMPVHLLDHIEAGGHIPGIFIVKRYLTFGEIIAELRLIWTASTPDEFLDQIQYLSLQKCC
jgi:hypothetical protein